MSRYIPGTAEGDLLIAQAIAGAAEEEVAKQLRHYLPEATYAPVAAIDATLRTVTVDLYGRSEYRVTVPVIGTMPEASGQVQVQLLPNGRSYAQAAGGAAGGGGTPVDLSSLQEALDGHARSNAHLVRWNTANTLGTYAGQWSLIASGELEERYAHLSAVITISGAGPNATWTRGTLWLHIAQPDAFPAAPVRTLELEKGRDIMPADLVLRIVSSTGPTVWELYARVTRAWELMIFRALLEDSHYDEHSWGECGPFLASIPTGGTQVAAVAI